MPALRAVLEDIQLCACQQIIVLGDISNGIDPAQSAELQQLPIRRYCDV
jgi:hypothetical protein